MGVVSSDEPPTIVVTSITVPGNATVSLIFDDVEQVGIDGDLIFIFDADGTEEIAAPVVASPLTVTAGGNNVVSEQEG